jgi:ribonuclease P protein subunit POP4
MPITPRNILAHEWIGLQVTVKTSPDPGLTSLTGIIRDETRNTVVIEARDHLVTVPKLNTQFIAALPTGEAVLVDGPLLKHRPEDRVKKGFAKW